MACCTECFDDDYLREYIQQEGEVGECAYCGAAEVPSIDPGKLADLFQPLLELYEPAQYGVNVMPGQEMFRVGETLAQLMYEDWQLFSDGVLDRMEDLVEDILYGGLFDRREGECIDPLWTRLDDVFTYRSPGHYWSTFVEHMTTRRRYVFDTDSEDFVDPRGWLPQVMSSTECQLAPDTPMWRARLASDVGVPVGSRDLPSPADMGAPPAAQAVAGRANPQGIPHLYCALDEDTAVAEVRPWVGARVWVSEWRPVCELRIVDLTDLRYFRTPFGIQDLRREVQRREFMRAVSQELAKPVSAHESQLAYLPTQYVSEVVQEAGYSGIAYVSSQRPGGRNLVVFDPSVPQMRNDPWLVQVTRLSYQYQRCPGSGSAPRAD